MTLVFLAADNHTLITKHVDHVHVTAVDDEEDQTTYYDSMFFFLDRGILTLATSPFAVEHYGTLIGVIANGSDPEQLREQADREAVASLNAQQARMQ